MKRIYEFCDMKQRRTLEKVREYMANFWQGNDNTVTYALTGLFIELTNGLYNDPRYLHEKLMIIVKELGEVKD